MTINKWTRARITACGGLFLLLSIWIAREAFSLMKQALDRGNIDSLLECDVTQDVFRRLVR